MSHILTATSGDFAAPAPATADKSRATRKPDALARVFLLVGVAIAVFLAFTAYTVTKEIQGRAQLAAIKEVYFPVLQRIDADIVRIDKMEELYIQVVVAGDRDLIDKAAGLAKQADEALTQIDLLYPARRQDVTRLRTGLNRYQVSAAKASNAFLNQADADMTSSAADMNEALARLRAQLGDFRKSAYAEFVATLAGSQQDAQIRLLMGLALGIMNLGFMAVLVHFIRKNVSMMALIAEQNTTLEQRVAERTAQLSQKTSDINAMLQNMKLGVSTVIPGNRIHPEYSNYLRTIFCIDDLSNKDLVESFFNKSDVGVDARDQVSAALAAILGEDPMMFDFNSHLLVREMRLDLADGTHKILQMDWSPILNDTGVVDKVLLITQDVTQLRALEQASAQQKQDLEIIGKIIRIPAGKFNEFIESAAGFITTSRRVINYPASAAPASANSASADSTSVDPASANPDSADSTSVDPAAPDPAIIATLFRNMHTLKGNARTFEFTQITDAAHRAEQTYDHLRKVSSATWDPKVLLADLAAVESAVALYVSLNEDKLGRKGRASDLLTTRGSFVTNEQLTQLRSMIATLVAARPDDNLARLRQAIDTLGLIPLQRLVSGAVDSLSSLATELGKPTPALDMTPVDLAVNARFAEALKSSLVHLLRNSLDHGIETPDERRRANKPDRGAVRLNSVRHGDRLELHVSDDGRGLPLHKLYEKGLATGLFKTGERPSRQDIAEIIFRSGLSTASELTQVSGRGVGMEAVRTFLGEQGAMIRIELRESPRESGAASESSRESSLLAEPSQELGFAPFEFVIEVPPTALSHAA